MNFAESEKTVGRCKGNPELPGAARAKASPKSDLGSARVTASETSVAKGSPFATPRRVFFWRREIIREIQDIDREDSPQLKEKIIDASWADFYPLSFQ
jgi:hypothetical protein